MKICFEMNKTRFGKLENLRKKNCLACIHNYISAAILESYKIMIFYRIAKAFNVSGNEFSPRTSQIAKRILLTVK